MKDWDDVLPSVVQSLSDIPESHACILDFLRVLPEEVTEGRKITLTVRGSQTFRPRTEVFLSRQHNSERIGINTIQGPHSNSWK